VIGASPTFGLAPVNPQPSTLNFFFFFVITLGLELSDTKVYEPGEVIGASPTFGLAPVNSQPSTLNPTP